MKKSKFTEEQIAYALRLAKSGTPVGDVCRQMGVSEATFHVWKKKYAQLGVAELRQFRQLTEENARVKRLVAVSRRSVSANWKDRLGFLGRAANGLVAKGTLAGPSWPASRAASRRNDRCRVRPADG